MTLVTPVRLGWGGMTLTTIDDSSSFIDLNEGPPSHAARLHFPESTAAVAPSGVTACYQPPHHREEGVGVGVEVGVGLQLHLPPAGKEPRLITSLTPPIFTFVSPTPKPSVAALDRTPLGH